MTLEQLQKQLNDCDQALAKLRERDRTLRAQLDEIKPREQRLFRLFAEADTREKIDLEQKINQVTAEQTKLERELKGVVFSVEERQQERNQLARHIEPLRAAELLRQRKLHIEQLRREHEAAQRREMECDKRLMEARDETNRKFFAWRAAVDQLTVDEQAAMTEQLKVEWGRHSGPNAPRNAPWQGV